MFGYADNTRTVSIMVGMMTLVYNVDEDDDEHEDDKPCESPKPSRKNLASLTRRKL